VLLMMDLAAPAYTPIVATHQGKPHGVIDDAAQAIYNEFIADTAPSEINISHSHKKAIRDKVRLLWSCVSRVFSTLRVGAHYARPCRS
jgi:hypothetical protein